MSNANANTNTNVLESVEGNRHCSFCRSSEHFIRDCHCDEAVNLYGFLNGPLFEMTTLAQRNCLNNYTSREIKMLSVILDLRIFSNKAEMINNIIDCLIERKIRIQGLLIQQRSAYGTNTIIINCREIGENEANELAEIECPICFNSHNIVRTFLTNCNHSFCVECMVTHLKRDVHCKCPMCRTRVTRLESKQVNPSGNILGEREYQIDRL